MKIKVQVQEIKELDAEIQRLQERRLELLRMMEPEERRKYQARPPKFILEALRQYVIRDT